MHPCARCGDQPLPAQFLEHAVHVHRRGVQSVAKRCLGDRNIGDVVLNTSELQELYGVSTASIRAFTLHSTLAQYSAQLLPEQIRELIKATGKDRGALVAAAAHGRYRMEGRLPRTRSEVDREDGGIRGMAQRAGSAPESFTTHSGLGSSPSTDSSEVRVWNGAKIVSGSRNIGPPLWFEKQRHSRTNQASDRLGQARGPYPQILRK